jgi:D-glycero-D-manno-heptose 1,7-bisphosphate phosphatase
MKRQALFLDRDGVVNVDKHFVHRAEDCDFIPGIFELVAGFAARGFAAVIATNQSGIGRGLFSEATFTQFMDWMRAEFARNGAPIDAVYFDPTHPTEAKGDYCRVSAWRKPAPGMFLQAAGDLDLDLAASAAVGNMTTDIEAGRAAGIPLQFLLDAEAKAARRDGDHWVVPSLADVARLGLAGAAR